MQKPDWDVHVGTDKEMEFIDDSLGERIFPPAKIDKIYVESYVAACAYWMLWSVSSVQDIWEKDSDLSDPKYLNLHKNWRPEDNLRRPRVIYRIQAFIEVARKHNALPHLCSMAEQVLVELKSIWPQTKPLEYYPAFM